MDGTKAIFENDNYKAISELVNEKIHVLKENQDFNEKYVKFFDLMERLTNNLKDENKDLFNEFVDLYYKTEEYYMALAFSLGVKYGNELEKI